MTKDSGIRVEQHRSVLQKEVKLDLRSLLGALGKAAVNGAFLQWDDLAENGVEVLESLGLESTPGEIAGLLIVRSLIQGMQNLTQEYAASLREKSDNLQNLYTQLNNSIATQELIINSDFFAHPEQLSLCIKAVSPLLPRCSKSAGLNPCLSNQLCMSEMVGSLASRSFMV